MTRERKIYAALLVLGLAALAVDKFVLGPSEAQAGQNEVAAETASVTPTETHTEAAVPASSKQPSLAGLTAHVNQVSQSMGLDASNTPDVFQTPAGWIKSAPRQLVDATAVFVSQHHLLAVLKSSHGGVAVIGSANARKSLRIGQQLDGFKLAAIGDQSVTFVSDAGKAELPLPADSAADAEVITSAGR